MSFPVADQEMQLLVCPSDDAVAPRGHFPRRITTIAAAGAAAALVGVAFLSAGASRVRAVTTHAQVRSAVQQLYTSHALPFADAKAALAEAKSRMLEEQGGGSQSAMLETLDSEMLGGMGGSGPDSKHDFPLDIGDSDDISDLGSNIKCGLVMEGIQAACGLDEDDPMSQMCSEPCEKAVVAVKRLCSAEVIKMAQVDKLTALCKGCSGSLVAAMASKQTCNLESLEDDDTLDLCSDGCHKPVCGILDACDPDSMVDLPGGLTSEDLNKVLKNLTLGTQKCGC